MSKITAAILASLCVWLASPGAAQAQSACGYIIDGRVLTAGQWNFCFGAKQDALGFPALNKNGDVMLGKLTAAPSAGSGAGFNLSPGTAPTTPNDGDVWMTTAGIFFRSNGVVHGIPTLNGNNAFSGAQVFSGVTDQAAGVKRSTQPQPAQITTDQNNYNPSAANCVTTATQVLTEDAARNITGLGGGVPGCQMDLINAGSFTLTLKDESVSSTAANRFGLGADFLLTSKALVRLTYDGVNSRWRTQPASSIAGLGTVTSITAGSGLSGGTVTTSGTVAMYFDPGSLANCTLAASAAGNALTIALKNQAGADPSAASPCTISFRSATAATGDYTAVNVTAATSFSTGTSMSTFGSLNATPFRLWITAFDNAGTVVLGVSNQSSISATDPQIFQIDEGAAQSSTACSACTTAIAAGTFYTTATQTAKAVRILGYMDWASGLATAGTWASGPTTIQMMGPGIARPGQTRQVVIAQTAASDAGSTTTSYTASSFTGSITPAATPNAVKVLLSANVNAAGVHTVQCRVQRGSAWTGASSVLAFNGTISAGASVGIDFPGSASAVTYTAYRRTNNGATTVQCPYNDNSATSIVMEEIQG